MIQEKTFAFFKVLVILKDFNLMLLILERIQQVIDNCYFYPREIFLVFK
jgi:hypothetical protein